jgi:hypothetical protein
VYMYIRRAYVRHRQNRRACIRVWKKCFCACDLGMSSSTVLCACMCVRFLHVRVYYLCVHLHPLVLACMYGRTRIHIHFLVHVCTPVCIWMCVSLYTCLCFCMCSHALICARVCVHTCMYSCARRNRSLLQEYVRFCVSVCAQNMNILLCFFVGMHGSMYVNA